MNLRRRLFTLSFALLLGALIATPAAAYADVDDFSFESMHADYTLSRDEDGASHLRVVETFVATFPEEDQNRGMRRSIPTSYNGQPLDPQLISVADENGTPRAVETDNDDDTLIVTTVEDDYVHGTNTYVFTYDLQHVTWFFPETGTEEFNWDVNGVDWAQPFGVVTASLNVEGELADALTGDAACYVGAQGDTARCEMDAGTWTASASDLAPYETVTIAVGFEPGTFTSYDTGYFSSMWGWVQASGFAALIGALAWAIVVRRGALRNDAGRPVIIAEYTPPAGIDALTSAVLLGKTSQAIPAEVLEQAIVGSIRIEAGSTAKGKLRAVLVDRSLADGDGQQLLDGLFGPDAAPGTEFEFGKADTRLSKTAQTLLKWAGTHLRSEGAYRPVVPGTRAWPSIVAVIGFAATTVGGVLALVGYVDPLVPVLLLITGSLVALTIAILLAHRPLTARGAELRDHLAGLKEFIGWAEADRIRMLQGPDTAERSGPRDLLRIYEPLLPYAVVFGQEKQWSERLVDLYGDGVSPTWYVGYGAFNAAAFSSGIGSLSASAMASSSTSGGSTGGGSAGGGGGGGGGGGA